MTTVIVKFGALTMYINISCDSQPSWVTDEEFGMGYLEIKPPAVASKSLSGNIVAVQNSSALNVSQSEQAGGRTVASLTQHGDSGSSAREQIPKAKPADGRSDRTESLSHVKSDQGHQKLKGGSLVNGSDAQSSVPSAAVQAGTSRATENQKQIDESANKTLDESVGRVASKNFVESEVLLGCF